MKYIRLFILLSCIGCSHAQTFSFEVEDTKRRYILHLPEGYDAQKQYPLVLNFHGLYASARQQQKYSGMDAIADTAEFIVVYPEGINKTWNTGLEKDRYNSGQDDIAYVNSLLDTLISNYSIDTNRIYSTGMSMGGIFSYRLACELGHRIAAIASVTGVMNKSTASNCSPSSYMPILQIQGTWDPVVNYKGEESLLGVEETLQFWKNHNKCESSPDTIQIPNHKLLDFSTVKEIKYNRCAGETEIKFYKIKHGGHTWPGSHREIIVVGFTNRDINASREIWNFFKRFTLDTSMAKE